MPDKPSVLIVDDNESIRRLFRKALLGKCCNVDTAEDGNKALECLGKQKYDIAILDIMMPKLNGIEVLKHINNNYPDIAVIMMTGHGTMRMAQECMQLGAYDYLTKPLNLNDLRIVIKNAYNSINSVNKDDRLFAKVSSMYEFCDIQSENPAIKSIVSLLKKIATTSSQVFIQGETGTGKELVAQYIHKNSDRKDKSFIALNCASLPESLLESELFGYEAGAFTDALKMKRGLLEVAHKGTLFLDEVAELSPSLQAKLLRAIDTKIFRRLGSNQEIEVDVRIISATNKDIVEEINSKRFRKDLFYRLRTVSINLPALRERKEDIPLLVNVFLKDINTSEKKNKTISEKTLEKMKEYEWPGNIRELRNVVEQLVILTNKDTIEINDLLSCIKQEEIERRDSAEEGKYQTLSERNRDYIEKVLMNSKWNRSNAAKILGITRRTLLNKIKYYGIKIPE